MLRYTDPSTQQTSEIESLFSSVLDSMQTNGLSKEWDNYIEVGEFKVSEHSKFIVYATTRQGFRYMHMRQYMYSSLKDIWRPGSCAMSVPLSTSLDKGASFIKPFEEMIHVLQEAADVAASMELMRRKYENK